MLLKYRYLLPTFMSFMAGITLTGCLDSGGQTDKNANPTFSISNPNIIADGTRPIFRPLETAFPLPSDPLFFLNPELDGTMLNGTDPDNPVTTGLGFVDGNSILAPFDIKISDSLDPNQTLDARNFVEIDGEVVPNPDQNVFVLEMNFPSGDAVFPQDGEVAGIVDMDRYLLAKRLRAQGQTLQAEEIFQQLLQERFRVDIITVDVFAPVGEPGGAPNNAIRIQPLAPLKQKTKYTVALGNEIIDKNGDPLVAENRFNSASNPNFVLGNPQLKPLRMSVLPARAWASEFFQFKRQEGGPEAEVTTFDDVTFAISFTTTAVEDVLLANAAPAAWFRQHLMMERKRAVISELVAGNLNLSGQPLTGSTEENQRINSELFRLLTDEAFSLFNDELAVLLSEANASGIPLRYSDLVKSASADRRLAYTLQLAAVEAVESEVDVSVRANQLAGEAAELLDLPRAHQAGTESPVRFFSQKSGGDINPALEQVALEIPIFPDVTVSPRVYEGEITLPYYQPLPDGTDGTPLQTGSWLPADFSANPNLPQATSNRVSYRFPFAQKQGDVKVPIIVAAPDPSQISNLDPTLEFPVIIYQHAATQDRSAILPMATAAGLLCLSEGVPLQNSGDCFVTVGIDLPLNGVFGQAATSDQSDGRPGMVAITEQEGASPQARERHFGFTAGPEMGPVDASTVTNPESGSLFLNFTNFANTRDNMRQGVLDLLHVNALLPAIENAINDCNDRGQCSNGIRMDTSRVHFISHSLSGMSGVPFPVINNLAAQDNPDLTPILASVLFNTGGHFSRLAENSRETIAPVLLPTLATASEGLLTQGRTELNIYFNVFQALLDSTDPVAFAPLYAQSGNNATLLTSIAGMSGDPARPSDGTIPNSADADLYEQGPLDRVLDTGFEIKSLPAPLTGTDPLARFMGAVDTGSSDNDGSRPVITRFLEGSHGNPVSAGQKGADPFSSSAVFDEMIAQMRGLFLSGQVSIDNECVVQGFGANPGDASCEDLTDGGRDPVENGDDEPSGSGNFLVDTVGGLFSGLVGGLFGAFTGD
ncbi:MAG: Bacterial virulence factor lipase N-terminal [Marinobacter excellens HL-55]|uniref:Bacterial virulence factor lipase N-terminal n=1 Tax=Marinobacter excellens HL-55 TaxID=1305731 RepID=A0A0P8B6H6_9GAMM|nr:MAG: Bacterial virulence factor lipase N-terminal [Marinobacter excellens HL-55]